MDRRDGVDRCFLRSPSPCQSDPQAGISRQWDALLLHGGRVIGQSGPACRRSHVDSDVQNDALLLGDQSVAPYSSTHALGATSMRRVHSCPEVRAHHLTPPCSLTRAQVLIKTLQKSLTAL
eukprot:4382626-Prymnesium_polylepis.1